MDFDLDDPFLTLLHDGKGVALWEHSEEADPHYEIDVAGSGWTEEDLAAVWALIPLQRDGTVKVRVETMNDEA